MQSTHIQLYELDYLKWKILVGPVVTLSAYSEAPNSIIRIQKLVLPHTRHCAYIKNEMENPSDFHTCFCRKKVSEKVTVGVWLQNEGLGSVWGGCGQLGAEGMIL